MKPIDKLHDIMARLRNPSDGCPWDLAQSFATIAPYTVEEAYEVADAIARKDLDDLRSELGDLLFQVVFHAQMASEQGAFDFDDVAQAIVTKMIRRHPHVFGNDEEIRQGQQEGSWETIKSAERKASADVDSVLDGIALNLPALTRAAKISKRAAHTGFDWPDATGPRAKIDEELAELDAAATPENREEELGDLLFSVVNLSRHLDIDPETALSAANRKFERRFRTLEATASLAGTDLNALTIDELEVLWQKAKTAV